MFVLAELSPLLSTDWSRPTLRVCSAQDRRLTNAQGLIWYPAITRLPTLGLKLFDGDFSSEVDPGTASFSINLATLALAGIDPHACRWAGAEVRLKAVGSTTDVYVKSGGVQVIDEFGNDVIDDLRVEEVFRGRIDVFGVEGMSLSLTAKVDTSPFDQNVLTLTYAGTGGAEGGTDLKDRAKPWIFGHALNVEPVLVNSVDSVFQFSAYGPIQAVNALYERGSSFGASLGDFANYGALVAATIGAGQWATCLAQGMVRLGAPPYGVITGDVDGDKPAGGWLRKTGEILRRVASNAGVDDASINDASLDALDIAVPYNVNVVLTDQESVINLARRMALPLNAQAGVSWLGQLFVSRIAFGSPAMVLDALGRRLPVIAKTSESDVSPPYKRIQMAAKRVWRVHTLDEIAFTATLVERGPYDDTETYREGNIVSLPDATRWLYDATTPSAGNDPAVGSLFWTLLSDGNNETFIQSAEPTSPKLGDGWIDDAGKHWIWSGTEWVLAADITATAQISVSIPEIVINADSTGAIVSGQLPKTVQPTVTQGTTDIRTATTTSYSLSNLSTNLSPGGTPVIAVSTAADSTKGQITVSSGMTGSGSADLIVTIGGVARPAERVLVTQKNALPSTGGGGGGGGGTGTVHSQDLSGQGVSFSSAPIYTITNVPVASGQVCYGTAPLEYGVGWTHSVSGAATGRWRYSPAGVGTWTDFGSPIGGSYATFDGESYDSSPGAIYVTQQVTIAAGNYDFQLMLQRSNNSGYMSVQSGIASMDIH
jgi:hypothetical protein